MHCYIRPRRGLTPFDLFHLRAMLFIHSAVSELLSITIQAKYHLVDELKQCDLMGYIGIPLTVSLMS